jgi:hypothetical protein
MFVGASTMILTGSENAGAPAVSVALARTEYNPGGTLDQVSKYMP